MSALQKRKSGGLRRALMLSVIGGLTLVGAADQVVVKTDVDVKSETNPFSDKVETVASDTKLEVLSRKDGWIRVRTPGGKEGFISEGDLPPTSNLASVQGNGQTNGVDNAAALRGLQDDAESYARSKSWNTTGVEQMIALGKSISDNDLIAFAQAGRVGPKKYRH